MGLSFAYLTCSQEDSATPWLFNSLFTALLLSYSPAENIWVSSTRCWLFFAVSCYTIPILSFCILIGTTCRGPPYTSKRHYLALQSAWPCGTKLLVRRERGRAPLKHPYLITLPCGRKQQAPETAWLWCCSPLNRYSRVMSRTLIIWRRSVWG